MCTAIKQATADGDRRTGIRMMPLTTQRKLASLCLVCLRLCFCLSVCTAVRAVVPSTSESQTNARLFWFSCSFRVNNQTKICFFTIVSYHIILLVTYTRVTNNPAWVSTVSTQQLVETLFGYVANLLLITFVFRERERRICCTPSCPSRKKKETKRSVGALVHWAQGRGFYKKPDKTSGERGAATILCDIGWVSTEKTNR